jgi:hypothetical protein
MGGSVKISARQLLKFLAGKQSIEEFTKHLASDRLPNPFHQMLEQGRLISSVTIEHHPEKDDDTAIIEFGPPDAAVSPFRVKDTSPNRHPPSPVRARSDFGIRFERPAPTSRCRTLLP